MNRFAPILIVACLLVQACERGPGSAEGPAPTAEERLTDWATLPEGTAVPVALGFAEPLADSTVAALLERHGLRPYAVYMTAAGVGTSQRRERSRASLELLAEAREQAIAQLRTTMCAQQGRARAILGGGAERGDVSLHRTILSRFVRIQRALTDLETGAPLIHGIEAVGVLEQVRGVGSDPAVSSYEPGWRGRIGGADTVVVPQPRGLEDEGAEVDSDIAALTPEQVAEQLAQLAENGMGSCAADASGP